MESVGGQEPALASYYLSFSFRPKRIYRKPDLSKNPFIMTSTVTYLGNLRTSATHLASGSTFITDAPVDNEGKGEAFSPTDTVATALASCLMTIMGIKARDLNIDLTGTRAEVTKVMGTNPRRIVEIHIRVSFAQRFDSKTQTLLERVARTCPVAYTLHPDLNQQLHFIWPQ